MQKRKESQEQANWLKNITGLHAKLQKAQSDQETLATMVETCTEWEWARSSEPYNWLKQATEKYKKERAANPFYAEWLSQTVQESRAAHGVQGLQTNLGNLEKLEAAADDLLEKLNQLKAMHLAMRKTKNHDQKSEQPKKKARR